jgi:hypothetical protein
MPSAAWAAPSLALIYASPAGSGPASSQPKGPTPAPHTAGRGAEEGSGACGFPPLLNQPRESTAVSAPNPE